MKLIPSLMIAGLFFSSVVAGQTLGSREVLLENEQVQVLRLTYPPGSESGMHTHEFPNRVVYFVQGGKLELISDDETIDKKVIEVKDGDTLFMPGITHNVKNMGTTQLIIIETEIK